MWLAWAVASVLLFDAARLLAGESPEVCAIKTRANVVKQVEATGRYCGSPDHSMRQVLKEAIRAAERKARETLGVRVDDDFLVLRGASAKGNAVLSRFLRHERVKGDVVKSVPLAPPSCGTEVDKAAPELPPRPCCDVRHRVEVVDRGEARDPNFEVRARTDRAQYNDGDTGTITVDSNRAGQVFMFIHSDGGILRLFPHQHAPDNRIDAGKPLTLPDAAMKARGIPFTVQLGKKDAAEEEETLHVVVLRCPIHVPVPGGTSKLFGLSVLTGDDFSRWFREVLALPVDAWRQKRVPYRIRAKEGKPVTGGLP